MGNTIRAIRRGIQAGVGAVKNPHPNRFQAAGKIIVCPHCGKDGFDWAGVAGISFAGYGIQCAKCSQILYFGRKPRPVTE